MCSCLQNTGWEILYRAVWIKEKPKWSRYRYALCECFEKMTVLQALINKYMFISWRILESSQKYCIKICTFRLKIKIQIHVSIFICKWRAFLCIPIGHCDRLTLLILPQSQLLALTQLNTPTKGHAPLCRFSSLRRESIGSR